MSDLSWNSLMPEDRRVIALRLAVDSLRPGHGGTSPMPPHQETIMDRADVFLRYIGTGKTR